MPTPSERATLSPRSAMIVRKVLAPYAAKIDSVAIFGSHATGRARENSDIDLVIHGRLERSDVDRLWTQFDESSLSVSVDLIAYNLPCYPLLRHHIDTVAKLLFEHEDLIAAPEQSAEGAFP